MATLSKNGKRIGRPPKYCNCLDFAAMVEMYFEECLEGREFETATKRGEIYKIKRPVPPNIYGLAVFMGFDKPDTFLEYEKKTAFSGIATRARSRIAEINLQLAQLGIITERLTEKYMARWHDMNPKHEFKLDEATGKLPEGSEIIVQEIARKAAEAVIKDHQNSNKSVLKVVK